MTPATPLATVWANLPAAFAPRARAQTDELGLAEPALEAVAHLLGQTQGPGTKPYAEDTQRVFLLLVAAIHAAAIFPVHEAPMPPIGTPKPITPSEWLLLADRERSASALPAALARAFDEVLRVTREEIDGPPDTANPALSPRLDYGLSTLWPALLDRPFDPALARAGAAIGKLTRLALEARAIATPRATAPRPALLGAAWTQAGEADALRVALAYAGKPVPDRLPLLRLLGNARLATAIEALGGELARDAEDGLDGALGEHVRGFSGATLARLTRSLRGARLFGFAAPPSADRELERAISLARDALLRDPELRGAWEVQAWGDWCEQPKIARLFPVGLCLLALGRSGAPVSSRVVEMLRETRRADGFRYYEGWAGIPPDTDDLGLVLRLVATLPPSLFDRQPLERPLSLFARAIDADGSVPVWLERDLEEPVPEGSPHWLGPRCVAVAAQALLGSIDAGVALPEGTLDRALAWVARTWEAEKDAAVFHYVPSFARLLLAKLSYAASRTRGDDAPRAHLRALTHRIEDELRARISPDGGWQSPLATACHLSVLMLGARPFDPSAAVTYLASRQGPDGMWPAEPLYRCPGKDAAPAAHGSREITTAVCLDALLDVVARRAASPRP